MSGEKRGLESLIEKIKQRRRERQNENQRQERSASAPLINQAKDQYRIPQFRRTTSTITVDPNVLRLGKTMGRQAQYSSSARGQSSSTASSSTTFSSASLTQSVPKRFSASYGPALPLAASATFGPAPPARASVTYPRPSSQAGPSSIPQRFKSAQSSQPETVSTLIARLRNELENERDFYPFSDDEPLSHQLVETSRRRTRSADNAWGERWDLEGIRRQLVMKQPIFNWERRHPEHEHVEFMLRRTRSKSLQPQSNVPDPKSYAPKQRRAFSLSNLTKRRPVKELQQLAQSVPQTYNDPQQQIAAVRQYIQVSRDPVIRRRYIPSSQYGIYDRNSNYAQFLSQQKRDNLNSDRQSRRINLSRESRIPLTRNFSSAPRDPIGIIHEEIEDDNDNDQDDNDQDDNDQEQ